MCPSTKEIERRKVRKVVGREGIKGGKESTARKRNLIKARDQRLPAIITSANNRVTVEC